MTAVRLAASDDAMTFKALERVLFDELMALARTAVVLFLVLAEERVARSTPAWVERGGRVFRVAPSQARDLNTMFGMVRYWRTYMREVISDARRGFHPLDVALGLTADKFSMTLLALAVRLATNLSFAQARTTLSWFVPTAPSIEVIEHAVFALGRHTAEWFEQAPAPAGDGDVLIIMFDSKGAPTATEEELARRRGKRRKRLHGPSQRHRGRQRRKRYEKKPRRKKGDHSKNAKMATMFVMYTLKREGGKLLGPINRRVYASFAPKEHAFIIARREADKRGFGKDSGKLVQIVSDDDLACYVARHFSGAIHRSAPNRFSLAWYGEGTSSVSRSRRVRSMSRLLPSSSSALPLQPSTTGSRCSAAPHASRPPRSRRSDARLRAPYLAESSCSGHALSCFSSLPS